MCDTLVALPPVTATATTLFAKNSDRERNEAQSLEMRPAAEHVAGSPLRLTYIDIPEAPRTHGCLLSRPFWMWGAEMGANDRGVTIGNEAVHSTIPPSEDSALTGMDLVRLGLERAATAAEAVEVMTGLLESHGQGGDCGHLDPFYYHNSFIIADPREAYVLETVGRWWAVEQVDTFRAISNVLGIGPGASYSSDVVAWAKAQGWLGDGGFDFAKVLMDPERDRTTRGAERRARAIERLAARGSSITVADMTGVLRDHGAAANADPAWSPAAIEGRTICMHAGHGDRRSQTVASWVADLRPQGAVHWVTGSSAPCLSIFKPVTFAGGLPDQGPPPTGVHDARARWWRGEVGHRAALCRYPQAIAAFAPRRDGLEASFRERIDGVLARDHGRDALRAVVDDCWREADQAEADWARALGDRAPPAANRDYHESWDALSARAGLTP